MDSQTQQQPGPFDLDEGGGPGPVGGAPGPVSDNEKTLAGLAYVSQFLLPAVMPVVLLLSDEGKRSEFVRFHSIHSLALLVVAVVYELLAAIIVLIVGAVFPCLLVLAWLLFFVPAAPILYYGVKAFQGERREMPYLTDLLRTNNWL